MTDITADTEFAPAQPAGAADAAPATKKKAWRKRLAIGLVLTTAKIALGYGVYWWIESSHYVSTDNAYVGAQVATINSQVGGALLHVSADDTQKVRKGDVLAVIDPSD